MSGKHLIVEGSDKFGFSYDLQQALDEGYSIVSTNAFWNFDNNRVEYYAMLFKTHINHNDEIPLTVTDNRLPPPLFE